MNSDRKKSLIVLGITLFVIVAFTVYLIVAAFKELWPFSKYVRPDLPEGYYYPTGEITDLSEDELKRNQELLSCLDRVGIRNFNKECVDTK